MKADKVSRVLAWLALLAAVVLTAAGEYALFVGCGFGRWVSAAGPVCLDAYAVAAIRARREVLPAVLLMVGSNATAHLLPPDGPPVGVVVAVASLAPLVLWRTHSLLDRAEGDAQCAHPHLEVAVDDEPSSWAEAWRAPWDADPAGWTSKTQVQLPDGDHREASHQREALAAPVVAGWSSTPARNNCSDDHLDDQAHDHPDDQGWAPVPTHDEEVFRGSPENEGSGVVRTPAPEGQHNLLPPADDLSTAEVMSDADLKRAARRLLKDAVRSTGKPVTVDVLRAELNLSRRRAVQLRRDVLGTAS